VVRRVIVSSGNPQLKQLIKLRSARERTKLGATLIEGRREVLQALRAGWQFTSVYVFEEQLGPELADCLDLEAQNVVFLSKNAYEKVAVRGGTEGVLAVARTPKSLLQDWQVPQNPFFLVLDGIEKPGNIGAILRTASACKVDAVLLTGDHGDPYSPASIRASLGAAFRVPIFSCDFDSAQTFFTASKIPIFAAVLGPSSRPFWDLAPKFAGSCAILLGGEAKGLSSQRVEQCDHKIVIPMNDSVDSLNVSVAGALLAYEVFRWRHHRTKACV
jgi:TrmH family RNA methyltransferase